MTNVAPDTSTWNIVLRRVSDPAQLKKGGGKAIVVIALSALFVVGGLALALGGVSSSGWIMAGVGLLAGGVWGLIAWSSYAASKWTGDDLIEILVADEGVIGQGGTAIRWDEISEVLFDWSRYRVKGGGAIADAGFSAAGIDTSTKRFEFRLKDYSAVKARTTSKIQRMALAGPMLGDPGYLHVGQTGNSDESLRELVTVITDQANRHGVPMTQKGVS